MHGGICAGESDLRNILTGTGVSLESQFRLTYSMILNLMRTEDLKVCEHFSFEGMN